MRSHHRIRNPWHILRLYKRSGPHLSILVLFYLIGLSILLPSIGGVHCDTNGKEKLQKGSIYSDEMDSIHCPGGSCLQAEIIVALPRHELTQLKHSPFAASFLDSIPVFGAKRLHLQQTDYNRESDAGHSGTQPEGQQREAKQLMLLWDGSSAFTWEYGTIIEDSNGDFLDSALKSSLSPVGNLPHTAPSAVSSRCTLPSQSTLYLQFSGIQEEYQFACVISDWDTLSCSPLQISSACGWNTNIHLETGTPCPPISRIGSLPTADWEPIPRMRPAITHLIHTSLRQHRKLLSVSEESDSTGPTAVEIVVTSLLLASSSLLLCCICCCCCCMIVCCFRIPSSYALPHGGGTTPEIIERFSDAYIFSTLKMPTLNNDREELYSVLTDGDSFEESDEELASRDKELQVIGDENGSIRLDGIKLSESALHKHGEEAIIPDSSSFSSHESMTHLPNTVTETPRGEAANTSMESRALNKQIHWSHMSGQFSGAPPDILPAEQQHERDEVVQESSYGEESDELVNDTLEEIHKQKKDPPVIVQREMADPVVNSRAPLLVQRPHSSSFSSIGHSSDWNSNSSVTRVDLGPPIPSSLHERGDVKQEEDDDESTYEEESSFDESSYVSDTQDYDH